MNDRSQWYIGTPNGVVLCIHAVHNGQLCGELYHSYSPAPQHFSSVDQMTRQMEQLYDWLNFPHKGTDSRSFVSVKPQYQRVQERERIMSDESLLSRHGDIGTFIVRVQHRQNSSWQGRITWMEQNKTLSFRSVWELMKLIESAVDTVSVQEDEGEPEKEPEWFEPEG